MTTTREHLLQIWGKSADDANDMYEGSARARLLKVMNKASGRTDADRQKDAEAATASRKAAEKDLADFKKKHKS